MAVAVQVDAVAVASAPLDVQAQRVLARPGMDEAKLAAIRARQVPDEEKRRRADFVIDTVRPSVDCGFFVFRLVCTLILRAKMRLRKGKVMMPWCRTPANMAWPGSGAPP